MVKESDMELMNWLCPECGLELHKHLTEIICPVSDVDAPGPDEKICLKCKWNNGFSGYSQVCAYALHGGETLHIRDGKPRGKCLLEDAPEPADRKDSGHSKDCSSLGGGPICNCGRGSQRMS